MKKTKILVTFGPAVDSEASVTRLVMAGANAFRINCSHGDTSDFQKAARLIRQATAKCQYPVGLLFDISGPKLRIERFSGQLPIRAGQLLTLTTGESSIGNAVLSVNHPDIIDSIKKGERVFIDDGALGFVCESRKAGRAILRALNSGTILPGKGINLPDSTINIPTIGPKDRRDIQTAIREGADYLALSFVRSPDDVHVARKLVKRHGGQQKIIAKLEKREAIQHLESIMEASDGVMIARGDLGVELPPEQLPTLQKEIIGLANKHRKPVIVATQMLESMRFSPRPTRAEVNDVASAVFDFADTVMLSAETATGKYPLEAVKMMSAVIETTERTATHTLSGVARDVLIEDEPATIARMVGQTSTDTRIAVIFAFTMSGFTAELISDQFPCQPIIALTPGREVARRLSLIRSVYPILVRQPGSFDAMVRTVNRVSREYKLAKKGEKVVITGGVPFGHTLKTNFLMIHEVA